MLLSAAGFLPLLLVRGDSGLFFVVGGMTLMAVSMAPVVTLATDPHRGGGATGAGRGRGRDFWRRARSSAARSASPSSGALRPLWIGAA